MPSSTSGKLSNNIRHLFLAVVEVQFCGLNNDGTVFKQCVSTEAKLMYARVQTMVVLCLVKLLKGKKNPTCQLWLLATVI